MGDAASDSHTKVERESERELAVTRTFDAPVRLVFDAWVKPELFKLWWPPRSSGVPMLSCEMDVRTGGSYRIAFGHNASHAMAFFGKYMEVTPPSHLVWTNDESEDAAVTTVTLEKALAGRGWSCANSIPLRRRATRRSPAWRARRPSSSGSWTHSSSR